MDEQTWYDVEIRAASEYRDAWCDEHGDSQAIYRDGDWRCVICGAPVATNSADCDAK